MKKGVLLFALTVLVIVLSSFAAALAQETEQEQQHKFVLPASLQVIEDEAFAGTAVRSVDLPEGVRSIGDNAFAENPFLTDVYIPPSVQYIADSAFSANADLVIHGAKGSYAHSWAKEHGVSFAADNVWILLPEQLKYLRILTAVVFLCQVMDPDWIRKSVPRAVDKWKSMRPQDRPELPPIDYIFP